MTTDKREDQPDNDAPLPKKGVTDAEKREDEANLEGVAAMFEEAEKEYEANRQEEETLEGVATMFEEAEREYAVSESERQLQETQKAQEEYDEGMQAGVAGKEDAEEEKGITESLNNVTQKQQKGDKQKDKKDPMLELMDELNGFVQQVNGKINDYLKEKAGAAWDKLKETGPMKTLAGALDEAKQFAKDKAGEALNDVHDSAAVSAAREKVSALKEKIGDAFSKAMNSAANAVAAGVHKAVTSKSEDVPMETPSDGASDPIQASKITEADPGQTIESDHASTTPGPTPDEPKEDSSLRHSG